MISSNLIIIIVKVNTKYVVIKQVIMRRSKGLFHHFDSFLCMPGGRIKHFSPSMGEKSRDLNSFVDLVGHEKLDSA